MKSLSELPVSSLRGVFTDIDDTLTDHGGIATATYAALARLRAAGLRVVLVTGRPAGWASTLASLWPIDAAVGENGAVAFIPRANRLIDELNYDDETERRTWPSRLAAIADDVLALPYATLTRDAFMRRADVAFDIGEAQSLDIKQIAEIERRIRAHGAHYARSTIHAHATYSAADKGKMAVQLAATLWSVDRATLLRDYVYVGDSPNDAAAFATFTHSVGVANVSAHLSSLPTPPQYVTPSPRGAGFVELCDHILG